MISSVHYNSSLTCTKQPPAFKDCFTLFLDWLLKTGFSVCNIVYDRKETGFLGHWHQFDLCGYYTMLACSSSFRQIGVYFGMGSALYREAYQCSS